MMQVRPAVSGVMSGVVGKLDMARFEVSATLDGDADSTFRGASFLAGRCCVVGSAGGQKNLSNSLHLPCHQSGSQFSSYTEPSDGRPQARIRALRRVRSRVEISNTVHKNPPSRGSHTVREGPSTVQSHYRSTARVT